MKILHVVVRSLLLVGCVFFTAPAVFAETGSCQTQTEGKFECMDFTGTGTLPPYLSQGCGVGTETTKWVSAPCPKQDLLGSCTIPRNDGIIQVNYCYRMQALPDQKVREYCRMSCSGTFTTVTGRVGVEGPAPKPIDAQGRIPSGVAPAETDTSYPMEVNTNRFGEDYKDLDLPSGDPNLCADACAQEPRCKAWTMVQPGVQGDNAKCWLKERIPAPQHDENCISGVKPKKKR